MAPLSICIITFLAGFTAYVFLGKINKFKKLSKNTKVFVWLGGHERNKTEHNRMHTKVNTINCSLTALILILTSQSFGYFFMENGKIIGKLAWQKKKKEILLGFCFEKQMFRE